jgi:hypothetical protein
VFAREIPVKAEKDLRKISWNSASDKLSSASSLRHLWGSQNIFGMCRKGLDLSFCGLAWKHLPHNCRLFSSVFSDNNIGRKRSHDHPFLGQFFQLFPCDSFNSLACWKKEKSKSCINCSIASSFMLHKESLVHY